MQSLNFGVYSPTCVTPSGFSLSPSTIMSQFRSRLDKYRNLSNTGATHRHATRQDFKIETKVLESMAWVVLDVRDNLIEEQNQWMEAFQSRIVRIRASVVDRANIFPTGVLGVEQACSGPARPQHRAGRQGRHHHCRCGARTGRVDQEEEYAAAVGGVASRSSRCSDGGERCRACSGTSSGG